MKDIACVGQNAQQQVVHSSTCWWQQMSDKHHDLLRDSDMSLNLSRDLLVNKR